MTDAAADRALQLATLFLVGSAVGAALKWHVGPSEQEERDRKVALQAKPTLVKEKRLREPRPPSVVRKLEAIRRLGEQLNTRNAR